MKLKDVLDLNQLFHPSLFYDGEWLLGGKLDIFGPTIDYMAMNAKKRGKVNLYDEYLEKHYYEPLSKMMDSEYIVRSFPPRISLCVDSLGQKRVVLFSSSNFLFYEIATISLIDYDLTKFANEVPQDGSREEQLLFVTKILEKEKQAYEDVLQNSRQSKYYQKAFMCYKKYLDMGKFNQSFEFFIQSKIVTISKLIKFNKKNSNFFEQEIDIAELINCFDFDTLSLLAAQSAIETCHVTEQMMGKVDNAICFVKYYIEAVHKLREHNKNYNCQIVVPAEKEGRKKIITVDDIYKEFNSLVANHPEFTFFQTTSEEMKMLMKSYGVKDEEIQNLDLSKRSGEELFNTVYEKFKSDKELAASWEIIPKGLALRTKKDIDDEQEDIEKRTLIKMSEEEKNKKLVLSRQYLEHSPYLYSLYGLDKFAGYIGYIYPNGAVIFERYYENDKTKRVARQRATYVMNISNFIELSKMSKVQIVSALKNREITNVRRIFHDRDLISWKQEINRSISGNDYSKEVIEYISTLVGQKVLSKKEVK